MRVPNQGNSLTDERTRRRDHVLMCCWVSSRADCSSTAAAAAAAAAIVQPHPLEDQRMLLRHRIMHACSMVKSCGRGGNVNGILRTVTKNSQQPPIALIRKSNRCSTRKRRTVDTECFPRDQRFANDDATRRSREFNMPADSRCDTEVLLRRPSIWPTGFLLIRHMQSNWMGLTMQTVLQSKPDRSIFRRLNVPSQFRNIACSHAMFQNNSYNI